MSCSTTSHSSGTRRPVAALPPELLGYIFQEVLPDVMDAAGRKELQHLRMVCSRWRALCFSTPQLWVSLTLWAVRTIDEQVGVIAESYAQLLEGWFKRAGPSAALELTVKDFHTLSDEEVKGITRFVHSLQHRWRYLSLDVKRKDFWDLIAMSPRHGWTNLRHIVVTDHILDTWMDEFPLVSERHIEDRFPPVKTLELTTEWHDSFLFSCVAVSSVETLVWHALEMPSYSFMTVLSGYRMMTALDLRCGPLDWETNVATTSITLESLKSFSFSPEITDQTLNLLKRFRLPALQHLNLTLDEDDWDQVTDSDSDEEDEESACETLDIEKEREAIDFTFAYTDETYASFIRPLLESCEKSLTSFSLKGSLGRDFARSILSVLPNAITNLHLQAWPYTTRFVDSPPLFPPSTHAVWLPKLESMRIFEVPSPHMPRAVGLKSIESLILFSKARAEPSTLRSRFVSLEVTRGSIIFQAGDFQQLDGTGLKAIVWANTHEQR
ncbi:hypothetical protein BKA70DRAFT_1307454 [Coprinopsis sp. MPI-PUGE-AT-0042]|nr:hypothetical protein BKA70DRAFT_1307454 [Coprinopsis sp. MPI-PUGE-AT-0042]